MPVKTINYTKLMLKWENCSSRKRGKFPIDILKGENRWYPVGNFKGLNDHITRNFDYTSGRALTELFGIK